jgi:hypothetical protein
VVTSHYAYNSIEGFGTKAYNTSGLSLNVLYDTRDSTINAYKGVYASLSYQWNPTWFGSSKDSSFLSAELRTYLGLSSSVPRNVLAFWVIAQGQVSGALPYLALPSIGWDAKNRTGRGWIRGASGGRPRSTPRRNGASGSPTTASSGGWCSPTCPPSPGPR